LGNCSGLRIRDTVEAHVGRNIIKTVHRIKTSRKMQRSQHRHIDFSRPPPETAGMVMDKIERLAFAGVSAHEINNTVFMLNASPLIVVRLRAGLTGGEQLTAYARSCGSGHRGMDAGARHFALQSP